MRSNYWSCSKFADWLRGTAKPAAGTSKEWSDWQAQAKTRHPVRYWMAEEGLDRLQNTLYWVADKFNDMEIYVANRWVIKAHCLTAHPADIKPGSWCDLAGRLMPCMFNELVDFVEIEQAWQYTLWADKDSEKIEKPGRWSRWTGWRSPEAGVAQLKWAADLRVDESWGVKEGDEKFGEPTQQAKAAVEILELYNWWKNIRPNRIDPYEVSGWSKYFEGDAGRKLEWLDRENQTPEQTQHIKDIHNKIDQLEAQYDSEDEAMMVRLIKIRHALWT